MAQKLPYVSWNRRKGLGEGEAFDRKGSPVCCAALSPAHLPTEPVFQNLAVNPSLPCYRRVVLLCDLRGVRLTLQAIFAEEGLSTAAFCLEHHTPGMLNVKGRCTAENCTKIADYGMEGKRPTSCLLHRKTGMVDIRQRRPRRPRCLPVTRKHSRINVTIIAGKDGGRSLAERFDGRGGSSGGSGGTASLLSRGTGSENSGVTGKPITPYNRLMPLPPVSRLEPCPDLDTFCPNTSPHLSGGGGNSAHPQGHWHSGPAALSNQFGNNNSNVAGNDQPLRSWRQGGSGKSAATDNSGVPTAGGWAFSGQTRGDNGNSNCNGNGNGNGNGNDNDNNSAQQLPSPHHQESIMLSLAASMGGSASLTALNRFGSGGGGGGSGGYFGERAGIDGGEWGSPALSESLQLSAVSPAIEPPGYGDLSSSPSVGIGRDAGLLSVVKSEPEALASRELHMVEPDSADIWLRDLMQSTIVRETDNSASPQPQPQPQLQQQQHHHHHQHQQQQQPQHLIYSPGVMLRANSSQHMRNHGILQSVKAEPRPPSFHASQHQYQHQRNPRGSVLSLSNASRMKGGTVATVASVTTVTTRAEPTTPLSTVVGRSPSAASSGTSPRDDPEHFNDAASQGSYQHDLARAGGGSGGGDHGLASMLNLLAGARESAGPPNHLFAAHLPAFTGGGGGGGCDRSNGAAASFGSDLIFPPLTPVASPTVWGRF